MKFIRILAAGLLASALCATAACSSPPASSSASPGSGPATTISFLSWDNEQTMKPLIDKFQEENPGVTVDFSYAPPVPEYIQTLQTRLNAGTAPDVFIITAENRIQLMDNNLVTDITNESFMSNIADAAKVPYTKDGKVYGMATSSWGGGILYNKKLLSQVGFNDTQFASWDDFMAACQKLKDAGITPYLDAIDSVPVLLDGLLGQVNATAGGAMDEAIFSGQSSFAATWTEPLKLYDQLIQKGYMDKGAVALTDDQVLQEFEAGRVAMISTGSWTPAGIRSAAPDLDFSFMAVPTQSANQTYWGGAVSPGYAINIKTEHKDAALKFLDFLQSTEAVQMYNQETGSIMTTKDFQPTVDGSLTALAQGVRDGDFYLPMSYWPKGSDQLQTEATALLQQMVQGSLTPDQVAAGMDKKLSEL